MKQKIYIILLILAFVSSYVITAYISAAVMRNRDIKVMELIIRTCDDEIAFLETQIRNCEDRGDKHLYEVRKTNNKKTTEASTSSHPWYILYPSNHYTKRRYEARPLPHPIHVYYDYEPIVINMISDEEIRDMIIQQLKIETEQ